MITFAKTLPYLTLVMVLESMSFLALTPGNVFGRESHKPPPPHPAPRGERALVWPLVVIWFIPSLSFAVESPSPSSVGAHSTQCALRHSHCFRLSHSRDRQCSIPFWTV